MRREPNGRAHSIFLFVLVCHFTKFTEKLLLFMNDKCSCQRNTTHVQNICTSECRICIAWQLECENYWKMLTELWFLTYGEKMVKKDSSISSICFAFGCFAIARRALVGEYSYVFAMVVRPVYNIYFFLFERRRLSSWKCVNGERARATWLTFEKCRAVYKYDKLYLFK